MVQKGGKGHLRARARTRDSHGATTLNGDVQEKYKKTAPQVDAGRFVPSRGVQ